MHVLRAGLYTGTGVCATASRGAGVVSFPIACNAGFRNVSATLMEISAWWRSFADRELDRLVDEGLAANHDLRIATARVDEYAARVAGTRAQGLPQVGYGANAGRQRVGGAVGNSFSGLLSASWELDLWGRIRRENEAARANLFATEQPASACLTWCRPSFRIRHVA